MSARAEFWREICRAWRRRSPKIALNQGVSMRDIDKSQWLTYDEYISRARVIAQLRFGHSARSEFWRDVREAWERKSPFLCDRLGFNPWFMGPDGYWWDWPNYEDYISEARRVFHMRFGATDA